MKVEAVRDDGALLITQGDAAAVVVDERVWYMSRASALSKGSIWIRARDQSVPSVLVERLRLGLTELQQQLLDRAY